MKYIKQFPLVLTLALATFLYPGSALAVGTNLSNTPLQPSFRPDIVVDKKEVYVVWSERLQPAQHEIVFRKSEDGGLSFGSAQVISGTFPSHGGPSVAVSGKNVYVAWPRTNDTVVLARSTDGGLSFEAPRSIHQDPNGISEVQIAAAKNSVYLVWEGIIDPDGSSVEDVFFARSDDKGVTFSNATNLSQSPQESSPDAQIATNGKDVYVVWTEDTLDPLDPPALVLLRASSDFGASFGPPRRLPTGTSNVNMSRVSTNEIGDVVAVAWRDVGEHPGTTDEIIFTASRDAGLTFPSPVNVSDSPDVGSAHPELNTNSKGTTSIVWLEGSTPTGGQQPEDVFLRRTDNVTFAAPANVSQTVAGAIGPAVDLDASGNSYVV